MTSPGRSKKPAPAAGENPARTDSSSPEPDQRVAARLHRQVREKRGEQRSRALSQLIQIIPSPTRSALASGNFEGYRISDPRIMGYLRNNSIFTFGKMDRARTSASYREILDAMWLFTDKFERARAVFEEIKRGRAG